MLFPGVPVGIDITEEATAICGTVNTQGKQIMRDTYLPHEAQIMERIQEGPDIFTLRLKFTDPKVNESYHFAPGQFNMLYLHGAR